MADVTKHVFTGCNMQQNAIPTNLRGYKINFFVSTLEFFLQYSFIIANV